MKSYFFVLIVFLSISSLSYSGNESSRAGDYLRTEGSELSALYGGEIYSVEIGKSSVFFSARTHSISVNLPEGEDVVELAAWSENAPLDFSFLNVMEVPDSKKASPFSVNAESYAVFIDGRLYDEYEETMANGGVIQCTAGAAAQLAAAALGVVAACSGPQATVACAAALANYVAASIAWNVACSQE